ncbi:glucan biosynthesis protein [Chelatococcus reniformis]|uniref:Glucans biosynthesis protein G n=1 Tax=Chelatococcus reniformis TaxID=1494448 RepID=A0A916X8X5_9HYPH|nr:glucan biosynthesis protein [Chelatococcus reniformis]GGC55519.1 glucans biosynthesis protein G [Chelatococcus reniformis]
MMDRRQLLRTGAATAVLGTTTRAAAQDTPAPAPAPGAAPADARAEKPRFEASQVTELARQLAKRPFAQPANDLPDAFSSLSYEQYVGIRARPNGLLWSNANRGFVIEPLHRGSLFRDQVVLYIVEEGIVRRLGYDAAAFDFGRLSVQPPTQDIGFSGFRVFSGSERPYEVAIFQGATFFRAIARGQTMGVVARTLTLRPGETRGEEIPAFRAFWIEQPAPAADTLTIHALMDSESASGAVRFTVRPGDVTIIDVEVTLFARVNLDHVGWGGMAATYVFGASSRRNTDDVRAAVYDTNGLQMYNGKQEWLWRPISNPQALQISAFVDTNPRGFGLLQRDRDAAIFQDDDQNYERRPSLWVEPLGDWGDGSVQLIEIPTDSEVNDNVIAYWRPRQALPAGSETSYVYRQFWCWKVPDQPPLAMVVQTRSGRGGGGRRRKFLVEFVGDVLGDARTLVEIKPALSAATGTLSNVRVWPYPERKALRVGFELDPGNEQNSELRLVLEAGGKPLSETWLYRWTP